MQRKPIPTQSNVEVARFPRLLVLILFLCLGLMVTGCGVRRKSGAKGGSAGVKQALEDNANFVKSALEYTIAIERYEEKGFKENMIDDLNSWSRSLAESDTWTADPMVKTLPDSFRKIPGALNIESLNFRAEDAEFLQQAVWANAVAARVTQGPARGVFQYMVGAACHKLDKQKIVSIRSSNDPLFEALKQLHPELENDQLETMNRALLLFDWVVRNIQLDEMPVEYAGEAATQIAKEFVDVPTGDAATDGVDGPGYGKSPGKVLVTGKGDTWQKSNLFVLMCRQLGIDAVLLNVLDRNDDSKVVPWVVGVIIGQQIYLFDLEMGIPLPAKDYRRIATYKEVVADRSILTQLRYKLSESTDADPDYRIKPEQLDKVVVWLHASCETMSQRMQMLEPKLTGDFKITIAFQPSKLKEQLSKWKFERIELSPHPFQNSLYRLAFNKAVDRRKEKALFKNYLEDEYFRIKIPIKKVVRKDQIDNQAQSIKSGSKVDSPTVTIYMLSEARHRFLLGVFETDMKNEKNTMGARKLRQDLELGRDTEDAAQMFVSLTLDDSRIEEIMSDDDWLVMLGLAAESNTTMSDQELEQYKNIIMASMRLIRTDSSIWLALTNYEIGEFGNAQNWLNQIKRFDNQAKWGPLTQYNLARTHEALLNFQESIRLLRAGKSQQRFGNIIRARLLQRWSVGDESATKPE